MTPPSRRRFLALMPAFIVLAALPAGLSLGIPDALLAQAPGGQAPPAAAPRDIDPNRPPWRDDPSQPRSQDPKAVEILRAGIQALGGETAILGRKTVYIKRRVTNHDFPEPREGTITIWFKRPDKIRKEVHYPPNPVEVEGFDGSNAWFDKGSGPQMREPGVRTAAILDGIDDLDSPANYLNAELTYFNISQEIPGKLAHVVKVRKNGYTRELMFDVTTNLLEVSGEYENPWGAADKMYRYDRYRPVEGLLVPHREERWRSNHMVIETEIVEIKVNEPIDDAIFAYPAGQQAARP